MPPTFNLAQMPGEHMHALLAFVALMQQTDAEFAMCVPLPIVSGKALQIGGWAIALDTTGQPNRQFGRHANCSSLARCVNCMPCCRAEALAADVSNLAGGRPTMLVDTNGRTNGHALATARSFVPGLPGQSDAWVLTLCPIAGRVRLIATSGERSAVLRADGRLDVASMVAFPEATPMAAAVFCRMWKSAIGSFRPDDQNGSLPSHSGLVGSLG